MERGADCAEGMECMDRAKPVNFDGNLEGDGSSGGGRRQTHRHERTREHAHVALCVFATVCTQQSGSSHL